MRYDTTLKELLQAGTPRLWETLLGEQPVEYLTVELPSVKTRKPDFVTRLESGALFHLEAQSDNEADFEWRELEYYFLLYRLYRQPPIQYVLYFGSAPLTMRNRIITESLQYRYTLIDVRELNSEHFLAGEALPDVVLAVLANPGRLNLIEVIEAVVERLKVLPTKEQRDWLEKLMILSGLRHAEDIVREEAEKMGISLDIRDNKFFQEAYALGKEDGVGHGIAKLLRQLLESRFGELPAWASQRLETLDQAALQQAGQRLLTATKLEEVLTPDN